VVKKVFIEGMSCGHCAARIEKALGQLDGVSTVKVNLAGKFAELDTAKELDDKSVLAAIDSAGYQFVKIG
jgi:copper ion binding protein